MWNNLLNFQNCYNMDIHDYNDNVFKKYVKK